MANLKQVQGGVHINNKKISDKMRGSGNNRKEECEKWNKLG